ncbi:cardiolipin synthase [Maribacter cobaltidurans]|uniref:Cardiolipin synthase n=1 Tax=Maribacter cobaltidurans TaxID=1178778 RepID=A0A223V642_9FLAO|nr:cardiolipin synthase [Maribacter cobaltidurans]ASV30786.1 cardiolipin synthase [Maribacter cobaltidurans]GGD81761.1 cardiolipin synthase [Maribacter cobaltidurans]
MWTSILLGIYILITLSIVIAILLHGAKPSKSLAWLLAIFAIPVGGIILYLLLGRNRRKNKLVQLKRNLFKRLPNPDYNQVNAFDGKFRKLMTLFYNNSHFPPVGNNSLQLLKDGKTTFDAIFGALERAKKEIHIQYYIFEDGELANKLQELFKRKLSKGVKIRMIYDGIGSFSLSRNYLKGLENMAVEVYSFLPFKFGRFFSSLNYRNHRKIIVVDGKIAFTGGINISDKYLKGDPGLGKWHDMHIKIDGPAASHLNQVFMMDWYLVCQELLQPLENPVCATQFTSDSLVQIVSGGPDDDFPALEQTYFSIINSAKKYVYITNPYIIPSQALIKALQTAALSGVDVRLLVSENADNRLVSWSVHSYFETFLKSGIKIYLFPDGFLHSKIIVSDDAISSIGTANLDDRSFEQNYEVNAIIYEKGFAQLLKEDFLKDSTASKRLSYEVYIQRPWIRKLKEGFGKIFSPLL